MAFNHHQDLLHLEILETIKMIESRHITRSIENRAELLAEESGKRTKILARTNQLSNLSLKLYGFYLKIGHVKDEKGAYLVDKLFKSNLPDFDPEKLTFFEKIYLYESYVWYFTILQNFPMHYRYSAKWVELFEENPEMKSKETDLYMRGLNNLLGSLFFTQQHERFDTNLEKLETFVEANEKDFNTNTSVHAFLYTSTARINKHFIEGTFTDGLQLIPKLEQQLNKFKGYFDHHRLLVFHYKIACMYFGSGDNGKAIDHLNEIINFKAGNLRTDIQCYARILHLIAHYELGHQNLLDYLVKSVYRFLAKMQDLNAVQKEILKFLRRELYSSPDRLEKAFKILRADLEKLKNEPYEGRSSLYLDISAWLESKISGKTVEEVSRANFEKRSKG